MSEGQNPRVSVCLPVWNGERYLAAAIKSILSQSYHNFELIVSDDSSTDQSLSIINAYALSDGRIKVLAQSDRVGLFNNYNRCIAASAAPIIKFFAQDDLLHSEALSSIVSVFDEYPGIDLLAVDREIIDEAGNKLEVPVASLPKFLEGANLKVLDGLLVAKELLSKVTNFIGEPSAVAIRRAALNKGFDPRFHHVGDMEYWLRILLAGNMFFLDEKLCSFRYHQESKSASNRKNLLTVSDLLRLVRMYESISSNIGVDRSEQLNGLISGVAGWVYFENRQTPFSIADLREETVPRESFGICDNGLEQTAGDRTEALLEELSLFRELTFHTLLSIGTRQNNIWSNPQESNAVIARERHISVLEKELRDMLNSVSWKSTKVLRESNAKIFGLKSDLELSVIPDSRTIDLESYGEITQRQTSYMYYLEDLRRKITKSRSWKLTSPIRIFSGKQQFTPLLNE